MTWEKANFSQIEFNFLDQQHRRFSIQEIAMTNPGVRFEFAQEGRSNFRRIFAKENNNEIKQISKETIQKETLKEINLIAIKMVNFL